MDGASALSQEGEGEDRRSRCLVGITGEAPVLRVHLPRPGASLPGLGGKPCCPLGVFASIPVSIRFLNIPITIYSTFALFLQLYYGSKIRIP